MGDVLQWTFDLIDRVSGPAGEMQRKMGGLPSQLKEIDAALAHLEKTQKQVDFAKETDPIKKQTKGLQLLKGELQGMPAAESKAGSGAMAMGAEFAAASAGVTIAIDILSELGKKLLEIGIELGKTAIEAAGFKKSMTSSLEAFTENRADAEKTFDLVQNMAMQVGIADDDASKFYRNLLASGFKAKEVQDILAAGFDVSALRGGGEDGKQATDALLANIQKIKALGKLDSRELLSFSRDVGIKPDDIIKSIADARGISVEMAKKLAEGGELGADESITAILKTVQKVADKGGALGSRAAEMADKSVTAQVQILKNSFGNLFEDVNIEPLAAFLKKVNSLLDPDSPTGKRAKAFFETIYNAVFKFIGALGEGDGMEKIFSAILDVGEALIGAFQKGWPYVKAFGEAFGKSLKPAMDAVGPIFKQVFGEMKDNKGPDPKILKFFEFLGEFASISYQGLILLIGGIVWLDSKMLEFWASVAATIGAGIDWIRTTFAGFDLAKIATDLINGFWTGLSTSWADLLKRFEGLLNLLPAAAKKALGIASPSKVFSALGEHTSQGFMIGMEKPDVGGAMAAIVEPPGLAGPTGPSMASPASSVTASGMAGGGARGGGGGVSVSLGPITIDGAQVKDAQSFSAELDRILPEKLTATFEKLAMEVGAL